MLPKNMKNLKMKSIDLEDFEFSSASKYKEKALKASIYANGKLQLGVHTGLALKLKSGMGVQFGKLRNKENGDDSIFLKILPEHNQDTFRISSGGRNVYIILAKNYLDSIDFNYENSGSYKVIIHKHTLSLNSSQPHPKGFHPGTCERCERETKVRWVICRAIINIFLSRTPCSVVKVFEVNLPSGGVYYPEGNTFRGLQKVQMRKILNRDEKENFAIIVQVNIEHVIIA